MYNYDRNIVVAAFRVANREDLNPREKTLTDFDASLFDTYDKEVRKQSQELGIPVNVFTRSVLVFFATQSTVEAIKRRVTHACRYFDAVRPQPSIAAGGGDAGSLLPADE